MVSTFQLAPPPKKTRESVVLDRFVGLSCVQIWRNDFRYMDWTTCRTNYIHEFGIMSKQSSEKRKSRNPLLNHGFQSVFFLGKVFADHGWINSCDLRGLFVPALGNLLWERRDMAVKTLAKGLIVMLAAEIPASALHEASAASISHLHSNHARF